MKKYKILITVLLIISISLNSMILSSASSLELTTRTRSDPIISSDTCNYYVINYSSLLYMTSGTLMSGNNVYQKEYNILSGLYNIKKVRTVSGVDYYSFVPVDDTSLRLDVYNAVDQENANIQLFSYNSAYPQAQEFRLIQNSDGTYYIQPRLSTTRVLGTVSDDNTSNIQLVTQSNSDRQKWIIKRDKLVINYNNAVNNSTYSPSAAGRYALIQGQTPNTTDYPDMRGGNCCNFMSQCLYAGNVSMKPTEITNSTPTDDTDNWFCKKNTLSFRVSKSWASSTAFYQHMSDNFGANRIIQYQSAWDALTDYDYLCNNLTMGDTWQFGDMEYLTHSMVIYGKATCNGTHRNSAEWACIRQGATELIYAQNSDKYINGHVYYALFSHHDKNVVFYDISNRY